MNIYFSLLYYSLLSGVLLRAAYDALTVIKTLIISLPSVVRTATSSKPNAEITTAPIQLQNTSTVRGVLRILYPPPNKAKAAVTAAVDLIFSLLCALTVTLLIFGLNFGEIRWFVIPIMAAGYFLYGATLGSPLKKLASRILLTVSKLTVAVIRVLSVPIIKPLRAVKTPISGIIKKITAPHRAPSTVHQPNKKKIAKK